MRDEVAGDADEVGPPLGDPANRLLTGPIAARERRSEVEVGEMTDPETVQLSRQRGDMNLEHARPEPPGLDPAVDDAPGSDARQE